MVRIHPDPPVFIGGVAQLGERLLCKQEVIGSIPIGSTSNTHNQEAAINLAGSGIDWCFFNEASIGCSLTIRDRR